MKPWPIDPPFRYNLRFRRQRERASHHYKRLRTRYHGHEGFSAHEESCSGNMFLLWFIGIRHINEKGRRTEHIESHVAEWLRA